MNSLGPSDLTEAKKSWSGNRPSVPQRPPKNETRFWTARGTFGLKLDPQEKPILVYRCYHSIACALSCNLKKNQVSALKIDRERVVSVSPLIDNPAKRPKVSKVVNIHQPSTGTRTIIGILVVVNTHANANGGLDRFLM